MDVTEVRVGVKKTVSDGRYGNETYEIHYAATLTADEAYEVLAAALTEAAYEQVVARLKASDNEAVRDGASTPEEREARWKAESERRRRSSAQELEPAGEEEATDEERPF